MATPRKRTSSRPKNPSRRLRVEPLEDRTLLAVAPWPGYLIHDDGGDVFTVDPENAMALEYIATTDEVLSDMAFSPEGKLYGVTLPWWGGESYLYSFTTDFEAPSIGTDPGWPRLITRGTTGRVYVNALAFNAAGELFAAGSKVPDPHSNPNSLFKIDPDTGGAVEVLSLGGYRSSGDLTFDSHGNMYLTTVSGELLRIPPAQTSFEVVGQTGQTDFYGVTFGAAPLFYGFTYGFPSGEEVYQIDMATGESTLVTQLTHPWLDYVNGAATIFPPPTDLGEVDFRGLTNQQPTLGEAWYRVEAVRGGILTAEVANVAPAAPIDVTIYEVDDGNLVELETGLRRADYEYAVAGGEYYVQIVGADSDFDLRVANLVQIHGVGNGARVYGTNGADTFTFVPAAQYDFSINEVDYSYNFSSSSVVVVRFDGGVGHDSAEITGTSLTDTATLNLGTASGTVRRSTRYRVELTGTPVMSFDGLSGNDEVTLTGTSLADTIALAPGSGSVTQSSSSLQVTRVKEISVDGGLGDDTAKFTGTTSDETADLRYLAADFAPATGTSFSVSVTNVETISAVAGGGYDTVSFADSTQQDTFKATPWAASLRGPGFLLVASRYDQVRAESTHGGDDVALLYGRAGSRDTLEATPAYGKLTGVRFDNQAASFRYLHVYSSAGDKDVALLYGNPGAKDIFRAWPTQARLYGDDFYNRVKSFRYVHAYGNTGDKDLALLYGNPGVQDTFQAWPTVARLYGDDFYNRALSFYYVHAYANTADLDVALLYGNPGSRDNFRAWPTEATLSGNDYYSRALSFGYVHAYGNAGDPDVAVLYDNPGARDVFQTWPTMARLFGDDFYNRAKSFRYVYAYGTPGDNDVAKFYDSTTENDTFEVWPDMATLYGIGYYVKAKSFPNVYAYGSRSGNDQATLHDAVLTTDYLEALGNWAALTAGDLGFYFYVEGYDVVTAHSTTPAGDVYNVGTVTYTLNRFGFWVPAW